MKNNLIRFEQACGRTFTPELLKSRSPELVDLRDIFVEIFKGENSIDQLLSEIGKSRTSYYASVKRFNDRYATEESYRKLYNLLKTKITGQLDLFEKIEFVNNNPKY